MIIQVFVLISAGILTLSTVFAAFLYYNNRDPLIKYLLWLWICAFVSFLLQGVFNNLGLTGFIGFSTHVIGLACLILIHENTSGIKLPIKLYTYIMTAGFVTTVGFFLLNYNFVISSIGFAWATAAVLIHASTQGKKKLNNLEGGFRLLIFLNALHFMDYPFLRGDPNLAVVGFAISLCFYFCYSFYIPLFILNQISKRYNGELKEMVLVQTNDLSVANQNLHKANDELQALSAQNKSLLSVLVHDLASPIQVITGTVELLEHAGPSKDLIVHFERLNRATDQIKKIIQHAASFQLARSGKISTSITKVSIHSVLRSVIQDFQPHCKVKNLQLVLNVPDELSEACVLAEEERLRNQVFANLISNAIKFSYPNGVINVEMVADQENILIRVRDNGVGLSEEKALAVFEFDQPTTTYGTNGEKGMGLGLPIVKYFSKSMGGDVRVIIPKEKVGTCFEVKLKKA